MCLFVATKGSIKVIREPMSVYRKNTLSSWTPLPVSERRRIALDDTLKISAMCPELAPSLLPFVADLHVRMASHALLSGDRRVAGRHLLRALRVKPTVPIRQLALTVRSRISDLAR